MKYNWQLSDWANFSYDESVIDSFVLKFAIEIGELTGLASALTKTNQQEAYLQLMIAEALKTSEIEGEIFSREDLLSSIKKKLGYHKEVGKIRDKKAQGIASLMVYISENFHEKLTEKSIKEWHKTLMEVEPYVNPGNYRKSAEPMQVVSGAYGKEVVHYEAPPSEIVPNEMKNFVKWYNSFVANTDDIRKILIKTALSHLYFESIHPFEDGNGRIGRALAEKCLSESFNRSLFVSISTVIEKDKKRYYNALKKAQKSLEVTDWLRYFSEVITEGVKHSKLLIGWTVNKMKFLDKYRSEMNERQLKAVLKMFDVGYTGFEGGMTARKYVSINKTSRATATRDLQELVTKNIFTQNGEGRNVSYQLNIL